MIPITEIQRMRKKHGLTQKELADRSGVSQSLIAKIEAGTLDPTFTKAQKIFEALENLREKNELKAKDVMHKKVFCVKKSDLLQDVIKIIKTKGISQIPVEGSERIIGVITESTILNEMLEHPHKMQKLKAGDVMEDTPPMISAKTGIRAVSELLRDYPVVLVIEKGETKGIISKSDLLGRME